MDGQCWDPEAASYNSRGSLRGDAASSMASNGFGNSNVMLVRNESSTDMSIVAMLASCSPITLQVQRGGGGLEDAIVNCGQKRSHVYPMFEASGEDLAGDEDLGDDCTQQVEKKRRLTFDQVRSLEKNFEIENKLEPERKMQLAKELGLQPRQVAVWFQNRRARWKIKQLERDFEALSSDFDRLKSDYDAVLQEKAQLEGERAYLTAKMEAEQPEQAADLVEEVTKRSELLSSPKETTYSCEGEDVKTVARKETGSESVSSELLNADSPCMDSGALLPLDNIGAYTPHSICVEMAGDSNNIMSSDDDLLGDHVLSLHGCHRILVKLEEGSFQDDSCNYMLDEERGLPWWDWP